MRCAWCEKALAGCGLNYFFQTSNKVIFKTGWWSHQSASWSVRKLTFYSIFVNNRSLFVFTFIACMQFFSFAMSQFLNDGQSFKSSFWNSLKHFATCEHQKAYLFFSSVNHLRNEPCWLRAKGFKGLVSGVCVFVWTVWVPGSLTSSHGPNTCLLG